MPALGDVAWPPDPIRTERLSLRSTRASDREGFIDLLSSAEVQHYVGGPQPREALENNLPEIPGNRPGVFAVESDGRFIGIVTLDHHTQDGLGPTRPEGVDLDIGYLFLPGAWGRGYATEAVTGVLGWVSDHLPREAVALYTQTATPPRCGVWPGTPQPTPAEPGRGR